MSEQSMLYDMMQSAYDQINKKFEELIIEGLKRKGFEFKNRMELENFIKSNCKCEDIVTKKKRTYLVNGVPFLIHFYGIKVDINSMNSDYTFNANYGSYSYV